MFTIITNYKKLILGITKVEFGRFPEGPSGHQNQDIVKNSTNSNLDEQVQNLIKDGRIDEKDLITLNNIKSDIDGLREQTKNELKEYLKQLFTTTLSDGFKINGKNGLEAFKRILSITGNNTILTKVGNISFDKLDGKTLVVDDGGITVYDKDGYREGYLYNGKINYARAFWKGNLGYNDNTISVNQKDVDKNIDSILKKDKRIYNEQEKINKINNNLNKDISKLNKKELNSLSFILLKELNSLSKTNDKETSLAKKITLKLSSIKNQILILNKLENKQNSEKLKKIKVSFNVLLTSIKNIELKALKYGIDVSSLKTNIDINSASIKDISAEQQRLQKNLNIIKKELSIFEKKQERIDKENDQKELIAWNKTEFTEKGVKLIQSVLVKKGFLNKTYRNSKGVEISSIDGNFGKGTLKAIKKLSSDGKIGLQVLKKLGLVDKNNNAINGLTKDDFKSGQLEKGNSSKIKFNEVVIQKDSKEKTSTLEQIKKWFKEIFSSREDVSSFIGINGEKINIDFNDVTEKLSLDTPYFDGINDYDLKNIPKNIKSVDDAKRYLKENIIKKFKEEYDSKVMNRAISGVQEVSDTSKSYTVGNFNTKIDGKEEQLTVKLYNNIDTSATITGGKAKINGYYVEVNTTYSDGVSDSDTKVEISLMPGEKLTPDKVKNAVAFAIQNYNTERKNVENKIQKKIQNKFTKEIKDRNLGGLGLTKEQANNLEKQGLDIDDITKIADGVYKLDIDGTDDGYLIVTGNKIADEKGYININITPSIKTKNIVEVVRLMKIIYDNTTEQYNIDTGKFQETNKGTLIKEFLEKSKPITSIEELKKVESISKMKKVIDENIK